MLSEKNLEEKAAAAMAELEGEHMGKANLYTVRDYRTGEVLAKGTAGELEASGVVPKGYHTSEWAKRENNRMMGRKYNIGSEPAASGGQAPGGEKKAGR